MSLTGKFMQSGGEPIEHDGQTVHSYYRIPVKNGDRLAVRFLRSTSHPVQGVGLKAEKCHAQIAGSTSRRFVLWRNTAPDRVEVTILKAKPDAYLVLQNYWQHDIYGTIMMGLGNAGMVVQPQPGEGLLFRCSDGGLEPDFNDLVFLIILHPSSPVQPDESGNL